MSEVLTGSSNHRPGWQRRLLGALFVAGGVIALGIGGVVATFVLVVLDVVDASFARTLEADAENGTPAAFILIAASSATLLLYAYVVGVIIATPRDIGLRFAGTGRSIAILSPLVAMNFALAWFAGERSFDLTTGQWITFAVASLAIGFGEELAFRGVLMHILGAPAAVIGSVASSAVLFGLVHVGADAESLVNATAVLFTAGIPFALVRLRTGTIVGCAIVHAAFDFIVLALLGGLVFPDITTGSAIFSISLSVLIAGAYTAWFVLTSPTRGNAPIERS